MLISSTRKSNRSSAPPKGADQAEPVDRTAWTVATPTVACLTATAVALSGPQHIDKLQHIGICGTATAALGVAGVKPELAAGGVFLGATVGKELILDLVFKLGTPSVLDATANLAGVLAGYAALKALGNGRSQLSPQLASS